MYIVLCPPMLYYGHRHHPIGMCVSALFFAWFKGLGGRLGVRFGGSNRDNLGGHLEGQNGSKMGVS